MSFKDGLGSKYSNILLYNKNIPNIEDLHTKNCLFNVWEIFQQRTFAIGCKGCILLYLFPT